MTPAPAGSEPGGFEVGPELWLLALGLVATAVVLGVSLWLVGRMIKEDRDASLNKEEEQSGNEPREVDG